jgi:RNA polymerase sigma-70 factor (ECF subfamily)
MTDSTRAGHLRDGKGRLSAVIAMPKQAAPADRAQRVAEIFEAHADFVWRVLRRQGVHEADAEDATQEVFLVVHRKLDDYEDRGALRAWLFTICRQVASHHHRSTGRRERKERALFAAAMEPPDVHANARRAEAAAVVRSFLDTLDEPHATVFYLCEIEGMTAPEVSSALSVNLNTIYGRLRAARREFEIFLQQQSERA